jgi:glycosyltransferase involved in cell wall biosynthesis
MKPKVSVIMSVHNGEKYLRECVDSILMQTFSDFEFIIMNNGSTDGSREIVESYSDGRIRLVNQEDLGCPKSLNKGISLSRGEYIARMDADDISMPGRLEEEVRYLDNYTDAVIVGTTGILIDENGKEFGLFRFPTTDTEIRWWILFQNTFIHSAVMFRSKVMREKNLLYNEGKEYAEDYELWPRIIQHGKCFNIDNPLVKYRIHSDQIGNKHLDDQEGKALKITMANINRLGVTLPEEVCRKLREWSFHFPDEMGEEDIPTCRELINLLNLFQRVNDVDPSAFEKVRRECFNNIYNGITKDNIFKILFSSFFPLILREDKLRIMSNFSRRCFRKII